uniref:Uncharacterized protein n=1 Tax=viral metagenome TaxID=1070528 RepID=A0A6M3XS33_9ZZZZ
MRFISPEELKAAWDGADEELYYGHIPTQEEVDEAVLMMRLKAVAVATLKKMVEWGEEYCPDKHALSFIKRRYAEPVEWSKSDWPNTKRKHCEVCWQSLLDEIMEQKNYFKETNDTSRSER